MFRVVFRVLMMLSLLLQKHTKVTRTYRVFLRTTSRIIWGKKQLPLLEMDHPLALAVSCRYLFLTCMCTSLAACYISQVVLSISKYIRPNFKHILRFRSKQHRSNKKCQQKHTSNRRLQTE